MTISMTKALAFALIVIKSQSLFAQAPVSNKPDPLKTQAPHGTQQPATIPAAYDPAASVNYVRVKEAVAPVRSEHELDAAGYLQVKQSTQYLDGLGRTLQTVNRQATPGTNPGDLVTPSLYDEHGLETYRYLPYASSGSDGNFKLDPFGEQDNFYRSAYKDPAGTPMFSCEQFFYSQSQVEASPLNRLRKLMAPGNSWAGSSRGVAQEYYTNTTADQVILWVFSAEPLATASGPVVNIPISNRGNFLYNEGSLYKTVTKDENGHATVEYKNKAGQVILKKVQVLNVPPDYSGYNGWLCTYYVYDDLDQLRFVIPPKAVDWLRVHSWDLTDAADAGQVISELCFQYDYDERQRLIAKKVPGAGWVYMIYDLRNRLILSQDANLCLKKQWSAAGYDDLNRQATTGMYNCDVPRDLLRQYISQETIDLTANPALLTYVYTPLVKIYYDNLNPQQQKFNDSYNSKLDAGGNLYADDLPAGSEQEKVITKGLVTGTDARIMHDPADPASGEWLSTYNFYDAKGRLIQSQAKNYSGGKDVSTNRFDFSGKLICNYLVHTNPKASTADLRIKTNVEYDHTGRMLNIWKTINDLQDNKTLVAKNEYDELGQLKTKELGRRRRTDGTHDPSIPLEKLDYNYNIRGWLRGVNAAYSHPELQPAKPACWFGMELNYDWGSTDQANNQYNGNISLISWRSKGDGVQRAYGYSYDPANRLLGADFSEGKGGTYADNPQINFDVVMGDGIDPASAYDAVGNILAMSQWGLKPGGSLLIDKLAYTYYSNSNKLQAVTEDAATAADNKLGDFTDNNTTPEDYGYDQNGNMITDLNKRIHGATGIDQNHGGAIEYNHMNLPWKITVRDEKDNNTIKGSITYAYDATGNKLEKRVLEYPGASNHYQQKETVTTYLGGFVYEQVNGGAPALQFVSHEEGRVRIKGEGSHAAGNYDYFIKDHLGNTRMVLTDELGIDPYAPLTFDGDDKQLTEQAQTWDDQNSQPLQVSTARTSRPGNFGDDNSNGNYAMLVRKNSGAVGAAKLLKVMSGDRIHTSIEYYYTAPNADNSSANGLASLIASLAGTLSAGGPVAGAIKNQSGSITNALQTDGELAVMLNNQASTAGNSQAPKAYLNILFFDEQFRPDKAHSAVVPIAYQPDQKGIIDLRLGNAIEVPRNGYAYVYFSNESNEMVYFDNFMLTHERGPLLEETHYYPFGLTMAGISSKAAGGVEIKYKFNKGSELQHNEFSDGSGLELYDTHFRQLDPQIGRWWQIDPVFTDGVDPDDDETMSIIEGMKAQSPYASMDNNPVRHNDPNGNCATCPVVWQEVQQASAQAGPLAPEVKLAGVAVVAFVALWEFKDDVLAGSNGNSLVPLSAQAATAQYHQSLAQANSTSSSALSPAEKAELSRPLSVPKDMVKSNLNKATPAGRTASGHNTDQYGNKIGPSGKLQVNTAKHSTPKRAKDAARAEGQGAPIKHTNPAKGSDHYHAVDKNGNKKPTSTHHEY